MSKKPEGHITPYTHPTGGWGALKQVVVKLVHEKVAGGNYKTLLKQNQPDGFDCPGCAWPDREHASTFEFCENGVKAVAAEATSKRVRPEFFAAHTVTSLLEQSDYELEQHGRLTDPMVYDAAVFRVGQRDLVRIARVPAVFGQADFLGGAFKGERREWRTSHSSTFSIRN